MCRDHYLPIAVVLLAAFGCSRVDRLPTAATTERSATVTHVQLNRSAPNLGAYGLANFYPMAVGNRWRYAGENSKTIISAGGRDSKHGAWTREAVLTGTETINGREYLREEDALDDRSAPTGGVVHTVRWLREDRSGLYEVGVEPPRAPLFTETRLLAYPLHTGATWVTTEYPHTTASVEGMEVLSTSAGRFPVWRIRVRYGGHLPQEKAFVWYGRAGYLGMKTHLDVGKQDTTGHIEIIEDQAESLTSLELTTPAP